MSLSSSTSWPFKEAQKPHRRFREKPADPVRFETGFGPSGLPHIGTFAEVARTTWVRNAFEALTGWPTELIALSDDMDGLRKVPLNMPNQDMLREHIGKPLCRIPDPFGMHENYSAYMNQKLKEMLDAYGFDYRPVPELSRGLPARRFQRRALDSAGKSGRSEGGYPADAG